MGDLAIISDPHANLPALEAALSAIERAGAIEIWCLGDLVGRGPHPQQVAELVRARCSLVLAGNHDRVVCGRDPIWALGGIHSELARWSNEVMDQETLRWLARLPSAARRGRIALYHGGPAEHAWQFISTRGDAAFALSQTDADLVLVGHTHRAALHRLRDGALKDTYIPGELTARLDGCRAVLNPGAIGDGARAGFLLLDREAGRAQWRTVAYDADPVREDLERAGFGALARNLRA